MADGAILARIQFQWQTFIVARWISHAKEKIKFVIVHDVSLLRLQNSKEKEGESNSDIGIRQKVFY